MNAVFTPLDKYLTCYTQKSKKVVQSYPLRYRKLSVKNCLQKSNIFDR